MSVNATAKARFEMFRVLRGSHLGELRKAIHEKHTNSHESGTPNSLARGKPPFLTAIYSVRFPSHFYGAILKIRDRVTMDLALSGSVASRKS